MKSLITIIGALSLMAHISCAQKINKTPEQNADANHAGRILPGAFQTGEYIPMLKGKTVAVFANPTTMVDNKHLVDILLENDIKIKVIFGPEHGFRGDADAGETVGNSVDKKTGIPVVSLYGKQRKPTAENLEGVDVMVFDIQDVGTRFYTYINSMQDYLETAIEFDKPLLILDRPNPNGFYVDGPVLNPQFKSGVGAQPIPIVYGMTMGEYATMLLGERMLSKSANEKAGQMLYRKCANCFSLTVIQNKNYTHKSLYTLPIAPSPNLREMQSIYLYPSTCFFEGTVLSEGRGTDKPFQWVGHPAYPNTMFGFTPKPNAGAKNSKLFYQQCYGWNFGGSVEEVLKKTGGKIQLQYLIDAYKLFPMKDSFFLKNNFINKLAGNDELQQQIKKGDSEETIRKSWEPALSAFKATRKKYLLYEDFE